MEYTVHGPAKWNNMNDQSEEKEHEDEYIEILIRKYLCNSLDVSKELIFDNFKTVYFSFLGFDMSASSRKPFAIGKRGTPISESSWNFTVRS